MNQEPTISDVLEAIGDFSSKVDERFKRIESQMVTKEYLDDKMINLKADLTVVMRKEDHKLEALTKLLASKKVITDDDAKSILALEPFPQGV
jgi:esterase/lipase